MEMGCDTKPGGMLAQGVRLAAARCWPTGGRTVPRGGTAGSLGGNPAVLHFKAHPTVHYYLQSRFPSARCVDTSAMDPNPAVFDGASSVVVVRHARKDWLDLLAGLRDDSRPVILFMDDDLPSILDDPFLPLAYALRTSRRFAATAGRLNRLGAFLMVSTSGLADKYGLDDSAVLPPLPSDFRVETSLCAGDGPVRVFYHGTMSHIREIAWLRNVMRRVLDRNPNVHFEIFGPERVRRLYADLPRTTVRRPLGWEEYRRYALDSCLDIGLAPLADTPFNACRSHVKFFDVARAGGVGVYSDTPVFRRIVQDGENGILESGGEDGWVGAVCALAGDSALRERLRKGVSATMAGLAGGHS
ncbi:MAG: hypothetical protein H0S80_12215 [Desulfovibrionaceae bacterium]|nr:hypothetical protein [Desulfovibrionaceae bacterium]